MKTKITYAESEGRTAGAEDLADCSTCRGKGWYCVAATSPFLRDIELNCSFCHGIGCVPAENQKQ